MKIVIIGLDNLIKKCESDYLIAGIWKRVMARSIGIAKSQAGKRAPKMTGTLAGGMISKMDAKPIPLWASVTTNVEKKGFRYPFALEAGKGKAGATLHYRSGRRKGRTTRAWFSGALGVVKRHIEKIFKEAISEIEQRWSS